MAGNASNWFKVITGGVKKRIYSDTATLAEMIYTGRESRHPQPTGGSRCQRTWLHYTLLGLHLANTSRTSSSADMGVFLRRLPARDGIPRQSS